MGTVQDDGDEVLAGSAVEWAAWLTANHTRTTGVWLVTWRPGHGPVLSYEEAVVEALRFGWIDARTRPGDGTRASQWFSPRRPGGTWAATNKARIARLEAEGRLEAAGRRMVERAKADGSWTILDGPEAGIVPDDLAAAFEAHPGARTTWDAFPASVRKAHLTWIALAKRPETRAQRVTTVAVEAAAGRRA
ncbi:MAG: YdeI/OmpD-associated family protein [Chloroflexi bacterium]|nr:YdeI/OmpD-associated family protein [Chloroflexota bacterium]